MMTDIFPKAGVKVSFLVGEFIEILGGRERLQGLLTHQVCEDIVKPLTSKVQSSYCDIMKKQEHSAYGTKAHAFISHAHSYQFLDLISALEWLLRNEPDLIVWLDLISINQHQMDWSYEWLSTTFKSGIQAMGRTIMVMSPWYNPLPYTRSWCVFEAYCTAVSKSRFQIALSRKDQEEFLDAIKSDVEEEMNKFLATISAENSQCTVESDRNCIFDVIRQSIGFVKLDKVLFEEYHNWIIEVSLDSLDTLNNKQQGDCIERAKLQNAISRLYSYQGRYADAEMHAKQCMDFYVNTFEEDHPERSTMINNYGRVLGDLGRFTEARKLHKANLEILVRCYGEGDPRTFWPMNNLAWICSQEGDYDEARDQFEKLLNMREERLGNDHEETLISKYHLGTVLRKQGECEKAQVILSSIYVKQKSILGESHPDTIITLNGIARCHDSLGLYEKAASLHRLCWGRQKAALGEDHKGCLKTMCYLASSLYRQGEVEQSIRLYEVCLEKQTKAIGADHYQTMRTKKELEEVLKHGQHESESD